MQDARSTATSAAHPPAVAGRTCRPYHRRGAAAKRGGATHPRHDRATAHDLSLGGRVLLWRDTFFGFVHVLLPLERDGFRSDVIPLAGVEAASDLTRAPPVGDAPRHGESP